MTKIKDLAMIVVIVLSSITSIKFKYDEHGVQLELDRTKQALAAAQDQANGFALAGICEDK